MERLSQRTLGSVGGGAAVPRYDRAQVKAGIVHLGLGAFHRAHQAVYIDDCLAAGETGWGIVGASLRSPATRDALAPQDGLYTVSVRAAGGEGLRVIGSLVSLAVAPEDPAGLLATLCDPAIRIVSLTVTEKAYLRDAAGDLDEANPDIVADLADPGRPRTVHGFMVEALARRRAAGVQPFTVLCCDNLPANGETVHDALIAFAALRDEALARFVAEEVACPSTVIDRIVPATTDEDRARISARLGFADAWPVVTEPFSQWVVEDRFPAGRPAFEDVGVTMVADATPFEHMKLRLLNGSHTAIACLGLLSGHPTVAAAYGDPAIRRFVDGLWAEAVPTLSAPAAETSAYIRRLADRYDNTALAHRTAQIACDSSQKLPQRIVSTALERVVAGAPLDHLAGVIAAWIAAVMERGASLDADAFTDPLDARLGELDPTADPHDLVGRVFDLTGFGLGAAGRDQLAANVADRLALVRRGGATALLAAT